MCLSLELQFDEPLPVGMVARHLELLRTAGATNDTGITVAPSTVW